MPGILNCPEHGADCLNIFGMRLEPFCRERRNMAHLDKSFVLVFGKGGQRFACNAGD